MPEALVLAIVGAECTGKTALSVALARRLGDELGCRVACVGEHLRDWCDERGRTPQAHEQAAIMAAQHQRIRAAVARHDIVVCDTTALMTAVYSLQVFGDPSLLDTAARLHRDVAAVTLLTALDLPWVADGIQRDGPQVQQPVDQALRSAMHTGGIAFAVISGQGDQRLAQAMAALVPLMRGLHGGTATASATTTTTTTAAGASNRSGLFTRLDAAEAGALWACECCLPDEERALRRLRQEAQASQAAQPLPQ